MIDLSFYSYAIYLKAKQPALYAKILFQKTVIKKRNKEPIPPETQPQDTKRGSKSAQRGKSTNPKTLKTQKINFSEKAKNRNNQLQKRQSTTKI